MDTCNCGAGLIQESERKYGLCVSCQGRILAEISPRGYSITEIEIDPRYCLCGRQLVTPKQLIAGRCEFCTVNLPMTHGRGELIADIEARR